MIDKKYIGVISLIGLASSMDASAAIFIVPGNVGAIPTVVRPMRSPVSTTRMAEELVTLNRENKAIAACKGVAKSDADKKLCGEND